MPRFAAIGLDHRHIYDLTQGLIEAGATCAGHTPDSTDPRVLAGFRKRFPGVPAVALDRLLEDPSIDFVVIAAVPRDRAGLAVRAMRCGKHVMTDKPGVTTSDQLEAVRQAVGETGRRWSICFGRLATPSVQEALRLVRGGSIGQLIQVVSLAPHRLNRALRPAWFFDRPAYGGIINDIGVHAIDQFLAFANAKDATLVSSTIGAFGTPGWTGTSPVGASPGASTVGASTVGDTVSASIAGAPRTGETRASDTVSAAITRAPEIGAGSTPSGGDTVSASVACASQMPAAPDHHAAPGHASDRAFEDFAEFTLETRSVRGYARVDWFTPDGLPTWGDGRLFLLGTEGTIELRKNLDIEGREGGDHLFLVSATGTRHIHCADLPVDYYRNFLADVRDGTHSVMPQEDVFTVCRLALMAQARATRFAPSGTP